MPTKIVYMAGVGNLPKKTLVVLDGGITISFKAILVYIQIQS